MGTATLGLADPVDSGLSVTILHIVYNLEPFFQHPACIQNMIAVCYAINILCCKLYVADFRGNSNTHIELATFWTIF